MFELLGNNDIAVPRENSQLHPLAAVYRPAILPRIQALLAANQLRLGALFDEVPTRFVVADELRPVDPDLRTLMNLNGIEDYRAALALAGFQAPPDVR